MILTSEIRSFFQKVAVNTFHSRLPLFCLEHRSKIESIDRSWEREMTVRGWLLSGLLGFALSAPALAKEPDAVLRDAITGQGLQQGVEIFGQFDKAQASAQAGLGMLRFTRGIEKFAQAMYRHGLSPGRRESASLMLGIALPKGNLNPKPLTYEEFRKILADLSADMSEAEASLALVGEREVKLPVDLHKLRIDIDGDGTAEADEEIFSLLARNGLMNMPADQPFTVAFDTADIHWLRGYSNLIGTLADFWLAHDFKRTFDLTFSAFFPANLAPGEAEKMAALESAMKEPFLHEAADIVAMLHLIDWPVIEPARLEKARQRLLAVSQLNRSTWKLARAETDNDREWLPNSKQTSQVMPGLGVTDERIDAWLAAVAELEDILEGRKLLPHWRYSPQDVALRFVEPKPGDKPKQLKGYGVNLRRALQEPQRFDLVLWITGHAAIAYLEQGEVASFDAWSQAERVFEGNLFAYAFWFN
jgi:hypothetical protein